MQTPRRPRPVSYTHLDVYKRQALVFGDVHWTYPRLVREARVIAHALRAKGVRDGDTVALSMGKGPALIAAMIGIMSAGAAYVPVAVDCPAERRAFIVADAGIVWTVSDRAHFDAVVQGCLLYTSRCV